MGNRPPPGESQTQLAKRFADTALAPTNQPRKPLYSKELQWRTLRAGFVPFGGAPLKYFVDDLEAVNILGCYVAIAIECREFLLHLQLCAVADIVVGGVELANACGAERIEKIVIDARFFVID